MHRIKQLWINLSSSLWFVPSGMVAASLLLAMTLTLIDVEIGTSWISHHNLLFGLGADGARGMLAAIAGSMMTVASLTFSLTISTLATASAQYSSRLVRNFMRDRINQLVLGYFVSLFAYCLVVLRAIRGGDEGQFVPALAVLGGLIFALVSIGVLIYFIHHIADSIQAATILRAITFETTEAIGRLFPANLGHPADPAERESADRKISPAHYHRAILAKKFGFVQSVDAQRLIDLATEHDGLICMTADIGSFVMPASVLCELHGTQTADESIEQRLHDAYTIGSVRSIEQDAAFGIRQIVDIALKALSPGINDPTTAVMCVQHLGVVLESLATRWVPTHLRAKDHAVRVIAAGRTFKVLVDACLTEIRQSAGGNAAVLIALLHVVDHAARATVSPERSQVLRNHALLIREKAEATLAQQADLMPVQEAAKSALQTLSEPAATN